MSSALRLAEGETLADLACGLGGPGLWLARESGSMLRGIDASPVAVAGAATRAESLGLASIATFTAGTFAETGLETASCDAAVSFDALQYAPSKRHAFDETARILKPGGRLIFTAFEFAADRVKDLPVLGADPVEDYRPPLLAAGFDVARYEESEGWAARVRNAYQAVLDARDVLIDGIGESAFAALSSEMTLTLQLNPYRRRVVVSATKR